MFFFVFLVFSWGGGGGEVWELEVYKGEWRGIGREGENERSQAPEVF